MWWIFVVSKVAFARAGCKEIYIGGGKEGYEEPRCAAAAEALKKKGQSLKIGLLPPIGATTENLLHDEFRESGFPRLGLWRKL